MTGVQTCALPISFGLRIPEKELRNFVTISDLADYLVANAG